MIVAGCDTGSTTGKVVIMEGDNILGTAIVPSSAISETTSETALAEAMKGTGLKKEDISFCVGTGYGRNVIPFANKNVSEISCHGLGAFWANPAIRTIVDIGGQDCKVIRINDEGKVEDFVMNDKSQLAFSTFGIKLLSIDFDNNKLFVKLSGGCQGCSSSTATLKDGIERAMVNLYHLLNHLNLFGPSYLQGVRLTLGKYV